MARDHLAPIFMGAQVVQQDLNLRERLPAGLLDRAIAWWTQVPQERLREWRSWAGLGKAHLLRGDRGNALACFQKALDLNRSGFLRMWSHHGSSSEPFPVDLLQDTLRAGGGSAVEAFCRASADLGLALVVATYEGRSVAPELTELNQVLAALEPLKRPDITERILLNMIQWTPGWPDLWHLLGEHHRAQGNEAGVATCLRRLKALSSPLAARLEAGKRQEGAAASGGAKRGC